MISQASLVFDSKYFEFDLLLTANELKLTRKSSHEVDSSNRINNFPPSEFVNSSSNLTSTEKLSTSVFGEIFDPWMCQTLICAHATTEKDFDVSDIYSGMVSLVRTYPF